jgi:hypothetical protein
MRRVVRALAAAALFGAVGITAFAVAGPASADTEICDQYGTSTIGGKYVVMNNRWGTSESQCINVTSTGFAITAQAGVGSTSGSPVSYPAVYLGCHYTKCSPSSPLPKQVSAITSATSSISYTYVSGATYDASYDIWLDPTAKTDGVNQQEVMIWFNRQGAIQPIGKAETAKATIGGRSWEVWTGSNGSNQVISYVAPDPIASWSFSVLDFINDVKTRGSVTSSWYLTSIQAGFEPWIEGAGLAVTDFSAAINSGTSTATTPATTPVTTAATTAPATTPPTSAATTTPAAGTAACRVGYATNVWTGGYTASVTVTNAGTAALNGWKLGFTLPAGQTVSQSWNTTLTGASGALTASNTSWNGALAAGGNATFGFQGTYSGSFSTPTAFTLNGSACTTA